MVGRFLKRFGVGLLAAIVGTAGTYIGTFDFTELGALAILAAAVAALAAGGLAKLSDKIKGWLGDSPPLG